MCYRIPFFPFEMERFESENLPKGKIRNCKFRMKMVHAKSGTHFRQRNSNKIWCWRWIEFYMHLKRLSAVSKRASMSLVCVRTFPLYSIPKWWNEYKSKTVRALKLLYCIAKWVQAKARVERVWQPSKYTLYGGFDAPIIIKKEPNKSSHCCFVWFLLSNFLVIFFFSSHSNHSHSNGDGILR